MADDLFYYDLLSNLRKVPKRYARVKQLLQQIDSLHTDLTNGKASREDITKVQAELLPICGFNFGLLIPSMFHSYPFEKPLNFLSRPFMFAMSNLAPNSVVALKAGRQVGKCVDGDTEVITKTGLRSMQSLFDAGVPAPL